MSEIPGVPGTRQETVQAGTNGRKPAVDSLLERCVRSERDEFGQPATQGVIDGKGALGAADRDMHVEAAGEEPPLDLRIVGNDLRVPLAGHDRPGLARGRVDAHRDEPRQTLESG
jgi:hypothetical protein